jgi:hypothetical protein
MERPVNVDPWVPVTVTENWRVAPTSKLFIVAGVSDTVATVTRITVSDAEPERPFTVALMDTRPGATAVTTPAPLTVAMVGEPVDHVTVPMPIAAPFWSNPEALAVTVWPTSIVVNGSETETVVSTGTGGAVIGVGLSVPPPLPHPVTTRAKSANASDGGRNE